jgi:hypothetical protein
MHLNLKVPIPNGMQPGQNLKVRSPPSESKVGGGVVTATIPPRSQWLHDGDATEPFFVMQIDVRGGDSSAPSPPPHWREMRKRDIAMELALKTAKALTTKREAGMLPKAVVDVIEAMEAEGVVVERMMVVRTPVQEYVGRLMNVITIGKYSDAIAQSPYDGMFHLSLLINGRYKLEKNEVITLSDSGPLFSIPEGSEITAVHIPRGVDASLLSVRNLLHNTRDHMGHERFSNYCAMENNCQDFILAVLRSNGLASPDLVCFVKQDAEVIFNKLPSHTPIVAKKLTGAAAIGNKLKEDIVVSCKEKLSEENTAKLKDEIAIMYKETIGKKIHHGKVLGPKPYSSVEDVVPKMCGSLTNSF